MTIRFTDFGQATIVTPPAGTIGTSITLTPGTGARFPTLTGGDVFPGVIESTDGLSREAVIVTARTGDVLTVVRSASPVSWAGSGQAFYLQLHTAALTQLVRADEHTVDAAVSLAAGTVQGALATHAAAITALTAADTLLAPKASPTFTGTANFANAAFGGPATYAGSVTVAGSTICNGVLQANAAATFNGTVYAAASMSVGVAAAVGGVRFQVDNASADGQARFRHSTGLGFLIAQTVAANTVVLNNQDSASLILAANNTYGLTVNPDQTINLNGGSGKLRFNGAPSRVEVQAATRIITSGPGTFKFTAAHGGPRVPDIVQAFLRCEVSDHGHPVGFEIAYNSHHAPGVGVVMVAANATNVEMSNLGGTLVINNAANNANPGITNDCWRVVWRCIWL